MNVEPGKQEAAEVSLEIAKPKDYCSSESAAAQELDSAAAQELEIAAAGELNTLQRHRN